MSLLATIKAVAGLTIAASAFVAAHPAAAQTEAEFYRGKTITLGIPSDVGGGYDAHGRLLARHLAKYIPGGPSVIAQNMTAGAGLVLANNLYNTAPRDGTAIAILRASVLYEQIFGNQAVRFKAPEFNWIGNLNSAQDSCVFWNSVAVKDPIDFYAREYVLGSDGVAGMDYSFPRIYNEMLGTKFKLVTGYKGTPDRILAMQRGEIEGACGMTTGLVKSTLRQQHKDGKLKLVAQAGFSRDPDFPDVPNMLDQAKTPEQRQALEFIFAQLQISRAIAAPPSLPEARVATLRKAFDATTADPAFIEEARKLNLDLLPINGVETTNVVQRFFSSPGSVVERVRAAVRK
jgi:tripartite-type tricarboxylate transporter receptor subunit TctC